MCVWGGGRGQLTSVKKHSFPSSRKAQVDELLKEAASSRVGSTSSVSPQMLQVKGTGMCVKTSGTSSSKEHAKKHKHRTQKDEEKDRCFNNVTKTYLQTRRFRRLASLGWAIEHRRALIPAKKLRNIATSDEFL